MVARVLGDAIDIRTDRKDPMNRPSPAVARLTTDLIAAIEAICAARARDIVAIRMRGLMPPKRGRPRKERGL